jgi:hypothetical protein
MSASDSASGCHSLYKLPALDSSPRSHQSLIWLGVFKASTLWALTVQLHEMLASDPAVPCRIL